MSDFQGHLLTRLSELERRLNNMVRMGRVAKDGVKKNMVRVEMGGTSKGGKPLQSPWIRTGSQHGFTNENVPFEEGQTVAMFSMGGDFRQAVVIPYSNSEQDPIPEDSGAKRHTYRIRKPRKSKKEEEQKQAEQEGNGAGGGAFWGGGGVDEYKPEELDKQEDKDDEDFLYNRNYAGTIAKKGKAISGIEKFNETEDGEDEESGQQGQGGGSSGSSGQNSENEEKDKERDYFAGKVGDPDEQQQQQGGGGASAFAAAGGGQQKKEKKDHALMAVDKARVDIWEKRATVRYDKENKNRSDWTDGQQVHRCGDSMITITKDKITFQVGQTKIEMTASKITQTASDEHLFKEGKVKHNTRNIGDSHKHGDVEPGGGKTGIPDE